MSSLSNLFVAAEEAHRELPMPPIVYGIVSFTCFLALLGVLWIFRGTAAKIAVGDGAHGAHGAHGAAPAGSDHQGSQH